MTPSLTASACEVFTCLTIIVLYSSSLPPDSFHLRYITDASTLAEIYEMKNALEFLIDYGQDEHFLRTYVRPPLMKNFKIFLKNDPHSIDAAGSQDHVDMSHEA